MTDETGDNDLIQFASPKVIKLPNVRYQHDIENKENKNYLLDASFTGEHDTEIGRRTEPAVNGQAAKPSPALLSSITSLLDSTILENASATLNGSYYDSIISPLTPSMLEENAVNRASASKQQQTPVTTRPPREPVESGGGNKLNETNLDVVDFIEVNNDSLDVDFWLCDPKSTRQSKQSKQLQMYIRQQQQQLQQQQQQQQQVLNEQTQNTTSNGQRGAKNPYKWIKEEFEDKNLDKVKRTLLVTLDDIAKGFNRRSRSVSTTRTSISNYFIPGGQQQTPLQQQLHQHQQNLQQRLESGEPGEMTSGVRRSRNGGMGVVSAANLPQSKSIESILNESNADVLDSSPNVMQHPVGGVNYATIIKRKNSNMSPTQPDMNLNDSAYLTTQSDDSNQADYGRQDASVQQPAAHYEDMLDVQVVAKMQEESLRQSVLNLNKSTESNLNKTGATQPAATAEQPTQFKRGTYSTATITKRTNSRHAPVINFDQERRDSVSSSEHSSLSSTASNFESPFTSQANVSNDQRIRKSPKKITASAGLNTRRTTELVSTYLNNKNAANSSLSLAPTPPSGYQTITKSSSGTNGTGMAGKVNSSTRSNTPNRASVYSAVNGNGAGLKQDSTRLPTPRTSRSSVGNGYLTAAGVVQGKSKSPTQLNRSYLQQQQQHNSSSTALNKPPPAPAAALNGNGVAGSGSSVRTGRPLLAYGGQRSATTSILSQANNQTSWQQNKLLKQQQLQQQQQHLLQQQQQFLQQQQQIMQLQKQRIAANHSTMTHTSTSHSLASSNSINNMSNSPRSPTSSISASSSINQMAPLNASSPRSRNESRNHSPNNGPQQQKLMNNIISPSGLLTNGPLGRRTITSPSRMRDRSSSPAGYDRNGQLLTNGVGGGSGFQLNGSNGNLQQEPSKIPSPTSARKQQMRKSFLPQPVQFQQALTQPSVSPIRGGQAKNLTAANNWKDGCF